MRTLRQPPPAQGFVLLSALCAALLLVLLLVTAWSQMAAQRALARQMQWHAGRVAEARDQLESWIQLHLAELDGEGASGAALPDPLEALVGLSDHERLRVALSQPLKQGEVRCRMLAVWWPAASSGDLLPGFDAATGRFLQSSANTPYALVDGCLAERQAVTQAQAQLREVAARLEGWFQMRVHDDPRHRLDINHFTSVAAPCPSGAGTAPCINLMDALGRLDALAQVTHLSPTDLVGPWGPSLPLEALAPDAAAQTPPFLITLQMRTPWGQVLTAQAVQAGA